MTKLPVPCDETLIEYIHILYIVFRCGGTRTWVFPVVSPYRTNTSGRRSARCNLTGARLRRFNRASALQSHPARLTGGHPRPVVRPRCLGGIPSLGQDGHPLLCSPDGADPPEPQSAPDQRHAQTRLRVLRAAGPESESAAAPRPVAARTRSRAPTDQTEQRRRPDGETR